MWYRIANVLISMLALYLMELLRNEKTNKVVRLMLATLFTLFFLMFPFVSLMIGLMSPNIHGWGKWISILGGIFGFGLLFLWSFRTFKRIFI